MNEERKYRMSFTAASLRVNEMSALAKKYLIDKTSHIEREEVIKGRNFRTTDREFREIRFRVEKLSDQQLRILANGDIIAKKQMAFLAACKLYTFLREFVVEVLREKVLVFDYQLTEGEYITFFRKKSDSHPELEELAESTERKIKQLTYKILEQGGLIDNVDSKKIIPQILDDSVLNAIVNDNPEWLKIFLKSDTEIELRLN